MSIYSPTEHEFRRVEIVLLHVMRDPSKAVMIPTPQGITTKTFANRIRQGARLWIYHKWPSPLFDLQFADAWPTLVVSEKLNGVVIGPKGTRTGYAMPVTSGNRVGVLVEHPTDKDIQALAHLHDRGLLTDATHFPNMQVADAEDLKLRILGMNVGLGPHPERGYIML